MINFYITFQISHYWIIHGNFWIIHHIHETPLHTSNWIRNIQSPDEIFFLKKFLFPGGGGGGGGINERFIEKGNILNHYNYRNLIYCLCCRSTAILIKVVMVLKFSKSNFYTLKNKIVVEKDLFWKWWNLLFVMRVCEIFVLRN